MLMMHILVLMLVLILMLIIVLSMMIMINIICKKQAFVPGCPLHLKTEVQLLEGETGSETLT